MDLCHKLQCRDLKGDYMENKLFIWIGLVIFGGLLIQTFLQLESSYYLEAAAFIILAGAIYFLLYSIFKKRTALFVKATTSLAVISVIGIFVSFTF